MTLPAPSNFVSVMADTLAAGFNVFVEKPVDPEELIAVIAGVAESRAGKSMRAHERRDARHD